MMAYMIEVHSLILIFSFLILDGVVFDREVESGASM